MISDRIYDDIPPQMKNLNIVIPILMYISTKNIENALNFHVKMENIVYNVIFRSNILV